MFLFCRIGRARACFRCTEDAAVKIQSVFRGHKVRTDMKQGDPATTADSAAAAAASASKDGAGAGAGSSEPTRQELEAEFREDDKGTE